MQLLTNWKWRTTGREQTARLSHMKMLAAGCLGGPSSLVALDCPFRRDQLQDSQTLKIYNEPDTAKAPLMPPRSAAPRLVASASTAPMLDEAPNCWRRLLQLFQGAYQPMRVRRVP